MVIWKKLVETARHNFRIQPYSMPLSHPWFQFAKGLELRSQSDLHRAHPVNLVLVVLGCWHLNANLTTDIGLHTIYDRYDKKMTSKHQETVLERIRQQTYVIHVT